MAADYTAGGNRIDQLVTITGPGISDAETDRFIPGYASSVTLYMVEVNMVSMAGEAFDMIERLCDEFEINLAVHNHPKSPQSKYWKPENVLAVCRGRGKRIGACCDTGHWVRSDLDPVECLKEMEGRIITFHLKDVVEWGNPAARDVPLGTGKANYTAVLKELRRQDFHGVLSIEYEHDSPKLNDEVAQCIAFVEKTVAAF